MSPTAFPVTERHVSTDELAGMMGVSPRTIKRWVQAGMPSVSWGLRCRRFLPSQAMQWARHREMIR